jgi:hypothetical protein
LRGYIYSVDKGFVGGFESILRFVKIVIDIASSCSKVISVERRTPTKQNNDENNDENKSNSVL